MALATLPVGAQRLAWTATTKDIGCYGQDTARTQTAAVSLANKPAATPLLSVKADDQGTTFRAWGGTFNELDWDALQLLTRQEQDDFLASVWAPEGDLRFSRGRLSIGANDYARSWYSCDEVTGDFDLQFFNIDRDKQTVIPFIRAAQKYRPDLTFWVSPWCPPSWMKIHGDYPVLSSKYNNLNPALDKLLFGQYGAAVDPDEMKLTGKRGDQFPRQLATTDYMIQDPRYLQAYADYFCRFIDAYAEQGIPIDMVIYQNEAYSYTPYPGCAWTAEGTVRFNRDYLGPTLQAKHPEVKLYLGTFNTNRLDHVQKILADSLLCTQLSGLAFQWEGRDILPTIRSEHPEWRYMCSESECGWGSFDWAAAEHTFELINSYLGNGCDEYTIWNVVLTDNGESPWGWKQNALVRVFSDKRFAVRTPEFDAVRHYSHFIAPGTKILGHVGYKEDNTPTLVCRSEEGKWIIVAANFNDDARTLSVQLGSKYLNMQLEPHSFNTFVQ